MSNPDFSTALQRIREANADFLSLVTQIRDFLTSDKEITFALSDETIVVKGLLALIDAYKNGQFNSVVLDNGSSRVILSLDTDGNLRVEDVGGNLVKVVCTELAASKITSATITSVTADNCTIKSASGTMNVIGGDVALDTLSVQEELTTTSATAKNVTAENVTAGSSYTTDLYIQGDRRMAFPNQRMVFVDGGAPVNDFAGKMSGGYSGNVWDWSNSTAKPYMLGISSESPVIPDLICFQGNNKYSDFNRLPFIPNVLENVQAQASVGITSATRVTFTDDPEMAAVFAAPWMYVDEYNKQLVLREFRPEDVGKEIYYRTFGSPWKVYRTLTFHYSNYNLPISATLGMPYEIPAYSCVRFTINRAGANTEGTSVSILEIA